ncbi:hypothetical protein [Psychrobacter sp.]|uniref:hypothetical protein n=1 Tax=Psychrobacter sp. TaxID=56811 RepID=UPI003C723102
MFDSQPLSILDKVGLAGIIMKVDSSFDPNPSIQQLFENKSKFYNMDQNNIQTFNPMNKAKTTNWLRTALSNLKKDNL